MSGIYGIIIDQDNFITIEAAPGGALTGWESQGDCFVFRRNIGEFYDASEDSGRITIKGLEDRSAAALITYHQTPPTDEQLNDEEKYGESILNPDFLGAGGNRQGQRLRVWQIESQSPVDISYNGAQNAIARHLGYTLDSMNGSLVYYLQTKLGSTTTSLPGLQAEMAAAVGASSWNGVGEQLADV